MAKRIQFSEKLRRAVERSPMTRYQIHKQTGIDQSVLSKFVHRQTGLSLDSVDLLVDVLGLDLVGRAAKPVKRKSKKRS